jgi:hypothetical protein
VSWFGKDISKQFSKAIGVPKGYVKMSLIDVVENLLSALSQFVTIGEQLYEGVPFTEIMMAADPVSAAINETRSLMVYREFLYTGLPVEGKMCAREFRNKASKLKQTLEVMTKKMSPLDGRFVMLEQARLTVTEAFLQVQSQIASKTRQPPLTFVLVGDPGLGKSKLLHIFFRLMSKIKNREHSEDFVYTRNVDDEFWENYDPESHPYIHIPELGNESRGAAQTRGISGIGEVQLLNDASAYPVKMAFDKKGKVFADPEIIVIDTNNADMNANVLMHDPTALYRRFVYVHVEVLEEFRNRGSVTLDVEKSLRAGGMLMDRYMFTVYERVPEGGHRYVQRNLFAGRLLPFVDFLESFMRRKITRDATVHSANMYDFITEDNARNQMLQRMNRNRNQFGEDEKSDYEDNTSDSDGDEKEELVWAMPDVHSEFMFGEDFVVPSFNLYWLWIQRTMITLFTLTSLYSYLSVKTMDNKKCFWVMLSCVIAGYWLPQFVINMIVIVLIGIYGYVIYSVPNHKPNVSKSFVKGIQRRLDESMMCLGTLFGRKDFKPFSVSKDAFDLFLAVSALAVSVRQIAKIYRYAQSVAKEIRSEAELTSFPDDSEYNDVLNEMEEKSETSNALIRVRGTVNPCWNIAKNVGKTPVFTGQASQLSGWASYNMRWVSVVYNERQRSGMYIFGLESTFAVANNHIFYDQDEVELHVFNDKAERENTPVAVITLKRENVILVSSDLVVFDTKVIQFKNATKHLLGRRLSVANGYIKDTSVVLREHVGTITTIAGKTQSAILDHPYTYSCRHEIGMCGYPLVAQVTDTTAAIVGIHSAGVKGELVSYAEYLDLSRIENAIRELNQASPFVEVFSQGEFDIVLEPPVRKSMFRHEYFPHLSYLGKLPGIVKANNSSKLRRTGIVGLDKFFETVLKHQRKTVYLKPAMNAMWKDGVYLNPFNLNAGKMNKPQKMCDENIMALVIDKLTARIVSGLKENGRDNFSPIPIEEAINGNSHDMFFRSMNMGTSMGFPFTGSKSTFFDEETNLPLEEIKKMMVEMFEAYQSRECANVVFNASLKDEARESSRALSGKTRVFFVTPTVALVLMRMYLSKFYTTMVELGDVFCSAVGANMMTDAPKIVSKLSDFSPYIMEGDYSGYDTAMPLFIGRASATVIHNVLKELGYNDFALLIVRGLLSDMMFPLVNMLSDVFCKPGLQPSGKYGTAEDNSLRGLIMMMYAWYSEDDLKDKDFFDNVLPMIYGDDMLAAVKPDVAPLFNNNTYQMLCDLHYGLKFTGASKDTLMDDFVTIETMSFLKRNFVVRHGQYVAPLSLDSIYRMLEWEIPSRHESPYNQAYSTCTSFCYEIFFHCETEDMYDVCVNFVKDYMRARFGPSQVDFPTFYELYNRLILHENIVEDKPCVDLVIESQMEFESKTPSVEVDENLEDILSPAHTIEYPVDDIPVDTGFRTIGIAEFLERPVLIETQTIALDTATEITIDPWTLWSDQPSVRAKLRNFMYLRCNLHLRIVVSGTPFHYGKLLISYQPLASANANLTAHATQIASYPTARSMLITYLSQARNTAVLDVNSNQPVDIACPFIWLRPMLKLDSGTTTALGSGDPYPNMPHMGSLYIWSINDPQSVSATPSDLGLQVYGWAEEVHLSGPTATMVEVVTEMAFEDDGADERKVGPMESGATQLVTLSDWLSYVPSLAPMARPAKMVASGMRDIFSYLGWSRPIQEGQPIYVKNRPFANSSNTIGSETCGKVTLDPHQELTIDPRVCGIDTDDMVYSEICRRESYLDTFEWKESDPAMARMTLYRVTPQLENYQELKVGEYASQPTPMSFVAYHHQYWRGDITFRFEVVCSKFHRGKLIFIWEPNELQNGIISPSFSLNKQYVAILDLDVSNEIEVTVQYMRERPWCNVVPPSGIPNFHGVDFAATYGTVATNGILYVCPFVPLQTQYTGDVYVNVYVKSDNIQFNYVSEASMPTARGPIVAEMEFQDDGESKVVINPSSSGPQYTCTYQFGEIPLSFRSVLKRYTRTSEMMSEIATPGDKGYTATEQIQPAHAPAYNGSALARTPTVIEGIPYAFVGARGSIRKRCNFVGEVEVSRGAYASISLSNTSVITPSLVSNTEGALCKQRGSLLFAPHTNSGLEAELPFYSMDLFLVSFATSYDPSYRYATTRNYDASIDVLIPITGDTAHFKEFTAIGEDFSFMHFNGAPFHIW